MLLLGLLLFFIPLSLMVIGLFMLSKQLEKLSLGMIILSAITALYVLAGVVFTVNAKKCFQPKLHP